MAEFRESLLDNREACKQTIMHSDKGLCLLLIDMLVRKKHLHKKSYLKMTYVVSLTAIFINYCRSL